MALSSVRNRTEQVILASVSAASQSGTIQQNVQSASDIRALALSLQVAYTNGATAPTIVSGSTTLSMLYSLKIKDRNNVTIFESTNPASYFANQAFLLSKFNGRGYYKSPTSISGDAANTSYTYTDVFRLELPVQAKRFPLKVEVVVNAASVVFSANAPSPITVSLNVTPIPVISVNAVKEVAATAYSLANNPQKGTSDIAQSLNTANSVCLLGLGINASDLTAIQYNFRTVSGASEESTQLGVNTLASDDDETISGNQSGLYSIVFRNDPIEINKESSSLRLNLSSSTSVTVYTISYR